MASFGLSIPKVAKLDPKTEKYSGMVSLGRATKTSVQPSYAEGNLHADNQQCISMKRFRSASVTAGTDAIPTEAGTLMFGHAESQEGEVTSSQNDQANYVGYGFISSEVIKDEEKFIACVLLKVKFQEPNEEYETTGESLTFKTPEISGTALPQKSGEWRRKKVCDTQEEAEEYINSILDPKVGV